MTRLLASACAAAFAVSLAACGEPADTDADQAAPEAGGEPADASPEAEPEVGGEPETEIDAAGAEPEAEPVFAEARACETDAEAELDFDMPERGEEVEDADYNAEIADAYLAQAAEAECVFETQSGLLFRVERAMDETAPSPEPGELVEVDYEGWLPDGEVFDSSYERGVPAVFPSDGLIPGWVEALRQMRVGEQWTLYIPSELAYGERGTPGGPIGPDSALSFTVELQNLPNRSGGAETEQ